MKTAGYQAVGGRKRREGKTTIGGVAPRISKFSDIRLMKGGTSRKSHQPTVGYHRAD